MTFPGFSCNISCLGKPRTIPEEKLQLKDAPSLIWIKVGTALKYLWGENPKLHNIGDIAESIKKHGFQEIPKFDKHIGIKAGNGRVEALAWMEKDGNYDLPRGLAKIEGGEWVMPLLMGTDAESVDLAKSYAVDSNNLVLSGGDFSVYDQARAWDEDGYFPLLKSLADADALPISVDGDDVDFMAYVTGKLPDSGIFKEYDEEVGDDVEWLECPECGHAWAK